MQRITNPKSLIKRNWDMKLILFILLFPMSMVSGDTQIEILTAFDNQTPNLRWRAVNDNVMGGRSTGRFKVNDGILTFTGATNTNGGGFASIRSRTRNLSIVDGAEGVHFRARGDGRTYTFVLETNSSRASYWSFFPTVENEWVDMKIPFSEFWPNWRGMRLSRPDLKTEAIESVGVMIYDKQDGPFQLEMDWIKSY